MVWDCVVRESIEPSEGDCMSSQKCSLPASPAKASTNRGTNILPDCPPNAYSKDGVLVNCVLPGLTRTPALEASAAKRLQEQGESIEGLTADELVNRYYVPRRPLPIGRVGCPEDLAGIVAFLASERASWITGAAINVDGGWVKSIY